MVCARRVETHQGIQGKLVVMAYDQMQRRFRDKGWMETKAILRSGITGGRALELGSGPGYFGLEWLQHTEQTELTGLELNRNMITKARRNAAEYGFAGRTAYVAGKGAVMPFADHQFDAVFSNGALHKWGDAPATLAESWRVLKPGGRMFLADLRRDMAEPMKWFMWMRTKPEEIRPGLVTSINAAYTLPEAQALLAASPFSSFSVASTLKGLYIRADK